MRLAHVTGKVCPRQFVAIAILASVTLLTQGPLTAQQVIPGNNVNMVSGTEFPTGDPFLQRQNEPSLAVSTRNPLHLLAGANDYRTVDLGGPFDPLRGEKLNADAWLGLFKSFDGGRTWQSTLVPGFPQDVSAAGLASPIKGRQAGTDPVVRAGTNGLFYYAGLAFDRGPNAPSTIFVARFIDLNNRENGDPTEYLGTHVVDSNSGTRFLDKTALAVDVPRTAATCTITTPRDDGGTDTQTIPAGPVYVAYSSFTGSGSSQRSDIMFSRSLDCGVTWSAPKILSTGNILNQNAQIAVSPSGDVWVTWRRFQSGLQTDGIFVVRSTDGGATFSRPVRVAPVYPFDQGTTDTSFRANSFQTMTVDATGRVYVAWPQRGHAALRPDRVTGDARIVVSTSTSGSIWSPPVPLKTDGLGHQIMPAISFHAGKLRLVYYDLQEDVSQIFGAYVDELPILNALDPRPPRHTIDVYVAQAAPAAQPVFTATRLSDYAFGTLAGSSDVLRLQYNPPNLPLFRVGTAPFMGDYIDIASAPPFVQGADGVWRYNLDATTAAVSHGAWTDNRDVRPPADGDWTNYTPVLSDSVGVQSLFDPSQTVPPCVVGQTGMRNQNIYTAKITDGLFVGSPGNTKPLGLIPRAFVVIVENARADIRSYRLEILNQPPGGQASFVQFSAGGPPVTRLDASVPPFSTIARTVHVSSSEMFAQVRISVVEIDAPGAAAPLPGGQASTIVLNSDPTNPSIQNPSIQNPSIQNPDIQVAEAYNPAITTAFLAPSIQNPSIQNPSIQNPSIQNPSIQNPELQNDAIANPGIINPSIQNPSIQNPSIQNPSIQNPSIQNQDLVSGAIQDTTWVVTNEGNTTASYAIKLLMNGTLPAGFRSQLVLHKTYKTPAAQDCTLALQPHTVLVANIPDPAFTAVTDLSNPSIQNPSIQNATISLAPGESANVTLRLVDPNRFDGVAFDAGAAVAPATVAHSVNTEDAAQGITTPPVAVPLTITTGGLVTGTPGGAYSASLQTFAADGTTSWTVTEGSLPPGVTLDPNTGQLSGTPTTPGHYVFTVQATDSRGNVDRQTLGIKIDPQAPAGFSRTWNGADTNWANPANWSPAGVPVASDRVYISAAIPVVPTLTRNETIQDLFLENGATVDTNGFRLTVTRNADAGQTIVGPGTTVLSGTGGSASGVFSNLEITGQIALSGAVRVTGNLTLGNGAVLHLNGQPLVVDGQLVSTPPGLEIQRVIPAIVGPAASIEVSGVAIDGLLLNNAPLTIDGGLLSAFDNVTLTGFAPDARQLTVNHAGAADAFPMNGLSFWTLPTTGRLIEANDTSTDAGALVLNVSGSTPADGAAYTAVTGGAVVNWLSNPGDANLAIVQSVSPNPAVAGSVLTYTIHVTNSGPAAATNVGFSPGIPFGTPDAVLITTQGSCTDTSGNYSCQLGTIAAGATVTVTAAYAVGGTGTVFRTASVGASEPDPAPGNNSHTIGATLFDAGSGVNLTLAKSDSADPVSPGASFAYSLTVTNAGTVAATNVLVVDPVPAGVTITLPTATQGSCSVVSAQVLCSLGSIAPGGAATITLPASAAAPGIVSNTASVTSSEPELIPADNVAGVQTLVVEATGCSAVTFTGPISYQGSPGPTAVVRLVDMDHDGDLDAVATHEANGGGVDVFLNDGTGRFGPPRFTSTVTGPWIHVVADFNGDTHPDVITSSDRGPGDPFVTLRLLTNDGTGTLTLSPTFSIPFGGHLEALDLDRDGDQDLVIVTTTDDLALLRNDGAANFGVPVTILAGGATDIGFPAFGDFNRDNHTDAAIGFGPAGFAVVLADGAGGFLPPVVHAVDGGAAGVAAADLNGDGRLDLLIVEGAGGDSPSPQSSVALGDGTGGFGAPVEVVSGNWVYFPTLTDVNGDGRIDLTAISGFGSFAVRLGDGAGGFSAPVEFPNAIYYGPTVGDVNQDGRPDIVIGDRTGQLNVFLNNCGAPPANLGVTVAESADPVAEGGELTYTVTVTNHTGAAATGVRVTSVLSTDVSDEPEDPNVAVLATTSSAGGTLTTSGSTFTWTLPALPANSTATYEFRFRTLGGGTLVFTSGATSDGAETDPSDNTDYARTTVTATGRTIVVTNTNDSGPGSLRQAIIESNDAGDVDTIAFNIGEGGPRTIVPLSELPEVRQPTIIDGTTQPGYSGTPIIELNGNGLNAPGLFITGGGTTVRGLVINRFGQPGILIRQSGGNAIEGNYIGTDLTGTLARPNGVGVYVASGSNRVGGTTAAARNLLSGNTFDGIAIDVGADGNVVQGNHIGTNAAGTAVLANNQVGVRISSAGNTVGGSVPGARNVISGNANGGIALLNPATRNNVEGNFIGTDVNGTAALGNGTSHGIFINGPDNRIGGPAPEQRNVISGHGIRNGIQIGQATALNNGIQGNYIGTDVTGTIRLPNQNGIVVTNSATGTIVGGSGNLISGNNNDGIAITNGATGTVLRDNVIGLDAAGTAPLGNTNRGVFVDAASAVIGGTTAADRNVIGGNGTGVQFGANATGARLLGNYIGTNLTGAAAVPNGTGVRVMPATGVLIGGAEPGAGNLVSGNSTNGIMLSGSVDARIQGNLVGTNASGTAALANGNHGISIGGATTGTLVGGEEDGAANTISANLWEGLFIQSAGGNLVQGNRIGTNAAGTAALGNRGGISILSAGNTVGGTTVEAGNLVSGNANDGIQISGAAASGNTIQGNYIGIDITGTVAVPNALNGISISNAADNVVGGVAAGAGNVVSGNGTGIQLLTGSTNTRVQGNRIGTNASGTAAIPNGAGINVGTSPNNTIGGVAAGAGNLISGNSGNGIWINDGDGNTVQGNRIGTDQAGTAALPNGYGVFVRGANNVIGGTAAGAGNVISGNTNIGLSVADGAASTSLQGNRIGTNAAGTAALPNGSHGLFLDGSGTTVGGSEAGAANTIAHNGLAGIRVNSGTGHAILGNSIFANADLGIDVGPFGVTANDAGDADAGANNLQNFPVLTSAIAASGNTTIQGTLNSTPNTTFRIEFFAGGADPSGFGEGATPLGFVDATTDGAGNASFTATVANTASPITATATAPDGSTSEFSAARVLTFGPRTLVVSNTSDSGPGSLRQAILDANASTGAVDTIAFNIPGAGPHTIVPQSELPMITDPVVIDGTTEPDFAGTPIVEIDGSAVPGSYGLLIDAGNSVVRGLVVNGFLIGIFLEANGGNVVEGNYIGTDVTGQIAKGNLSHGIQTTGGGNLIGGTTAAARNVISGNLGSGVNIENGAVNIVQGNFIGLDRTGTIALPNVQHGIRTNNANQSTIGGATAGARNVVSGNGGDGITVNLGNGTVIQGNYVGTNAAGTGDLGNGQIGINIEGQNNTIGGSEPGAGNVISGNSRGINVRFGSNSSIVGNLVGVNASGSAALGNDNYGINVEPFATATTIQGNVVSGNGSNGVVLNQSSSGAVLQGNFIGTANDGTTPIPNQAHGVFVASSSSNTIGRTLAGAGTGNVIAGNGSIGIAVEGPAANNVIFGNSIFSNGLLGIDLGVNGVTPNDVNDGDAGPNRLQNYPVLTRAMLSAGQIDIDVTFNSIAGRAYTIEYFRSTSCDPSGFGEGAAPAGVTALGVMGNATTQFTASFGSAGFAVGQVITATATSSDGTSEFSACIAVAPGPTTFTVTNTDDGGPGSLRQAILDANARTGTVDTIAFDIPGAGPHSILLQSALPAITDPVAIDGTTEPDYAGTPVIELNGEAAGASNGLHITAGNSVVRGLAINRFVASAIVLEDGGGNVLERNHIGTDVTGMIGLGNGAYGVLASTSNNRIGLPSGRGNVISGNVGSGVWLLGAGATGNVVAGNLIGLNSAGTAVIPNGVDGVTIGIGTNNVVGGNSAADRNVISGNARIGVLIEGAGATGNRVSANFIGTDVAGAGGLGNTFDGVFVSVAGNTIGGVTAPEGNVIAANGRAGIYLAGFELLSSTAVLANTIGASADGASPLPNLLGIYIESNGNTIGAVSGNLIAYNTQAGIDVRGSENRITSNRIHSNGGLGIDLGGDGVTQNDPGDVDGSPNRFQNFPVLMPAVGGVTGTLNAAANTVYRIEWFGSTACDPSGNGEGQTYLGTGSVTTDGNGDAGLPFFAAADGLIVTATATDPGGNTSEFSPCVVVRGAIALSLVNASVVGVGRQATLRVTLPNPAPPEGVTVGVASGNSDQLAIGEPGSVFIASGQVSADIVVHGVQSGLVTVTATATGYPAGTLSVTVTQNLISTPATLNVALGQSTALPIGIGPNPAPPGGFTVNVVSSAPSIIEVVTPQITVPEGAFSVNATIRGAQIGSADVTVSHADYSPSTTTATSRAELDILSATVSFNDGLPSPELTIQLESNGIPIAAQPALTITLTSADPGCVAVPATVTIPSGFVTTTFSPAYGGIASLPCTAIITASATDVVADTVTITVNPRPGITAPAPQTVGAGLMLQVSATLGASQHGGRDVTVASDDPAVLVSPDASTPGTASFTRRLNNGQTSVSYYVQGLENTTGQATVTISAQGFDSASHAVTVGAIAVEIQGLSAATTTLSAPDTSWYVQVGVRNASGTGVAVQNLRPGGPAFVVTLTNSNANVGSLSSDEPAATGQTVTKPIATGFYYTQQSAAGTSFGLTFQPLGTGTTTVSVAGPAGVLTTTNSQRQVSVTAPGITAPAPQTVGAGLMLQVSAALGASQHGGRDVTVASDDPAVLVSPDATTPGTASFTRRLNNGQTSVSYYVQGLENTTGQATVTISAQGFDSASHAVTVAAVAVEIHSLMAETTNLSADDTSWYVQVGVRNASGTGVAVQNLRPGGPAFVVTLTNSDANVARLRSDEPAATGQTVTKPIAAGFYYTQQIAAGTSFGLAFDALANGTTTVSVTGPAGVLTTTNSQRQVTVITPAISVGESTTVGAGLQLSLSATLGASQHGGVDVTITSSAAVVMVSPDSTTAGSASITVRVNNGSTAIPFHVQGLENTTGTAIVTLSAPGFVSDTISVTVVQPAVEIHGLPAATTAGGPDAVSWYVQVGIPTGGGTSVSAQNVRAGGPSFVVTVANSNATAAELRSDEPAATGQSVTKPMQAGTYYTHAVAAGTSYGLALVSRAAGTTQVSVTGPPGVGTTTQSTRTVVINP